MSIVYTNNLDMHSGGVPLIVHLGQYDSDFSLVFNLYSSVGALTIESGTTAEIRGTKSDGFGYSADATIDIVNKKVTVAGSNQMTAAARQNIFELVILKNNKVLSSANFILDVEHAALDADTIQDESVLKELNAIIEGAATATQAAEDAEDAADRAEEAADDLSGTVQQVATNTQDIAELKDDLKQLRSDVFESGTPGEYPHKTVSEFFSDTYPSGTSYPPGNGYIDINDIENLNSWYVTTTEAMDIFFDSSLDIGTFIVAKISNVTSTERTATHLRFYGSDPERYRYADGEGFPTENDKLHLNANDTVIISLQLAVSPNNVLIYYGEKQQGDAVLNENVLLNETQINQVIESLPDPGDFPYSAKRALLECISHFAWTVDDGQDYYDVLVEALNVDDHLDSITAVFNQNGAAIYDTNNLDSLKPYLVVNANYADGSTVAVSDYVLSGTLTVGNCTITVSYGGKITTFVVKCIAYFDHVTIDGVSYDISLSGDAPYKAVLKFSNNLLYLYYSTTPFYVRGAFPNDTSQDNKYFVNIYGNAYRGVQSGTSFEGQGILGLRAIDVYPGTNFDDSNIGEIGREGTPRTLNVIKWSLNDICLYDNGYTDTVLYPAD